MGLAYTSAPATTTDTEQQFSEGWNQINWNQHSMLLQTFCVKMCVAVWSKAPLFNIDVVEQLISEASWSLCVSPSSESPD
ncbi:hypothetical protein C8Q72DRAFT_1001264 [Fomitopsis betulina]|nr:hypothetical protein C8Q72DRAFT_1001264 [Fomitopsis betulina]